MPILKPETETPAAAAATPHGRRGDHCCILLAQLITDLHHEADHTGLRWLRDLANRYDPTRP